MSTTAALEQFARRQVDEYREQLNHYAELVRARDQRPQKLALYFPLQKHLQVLEQND